jgi:hypothetical protein
MATKWQGNSGTNIEVEAGTQAARFVQRSNDFGALGMYNKALISGTMAAGIVAASNIFTFRYGAANVCLMRRIRLSVANAGTAFTAGFGLFNAFVARAFTANSSGGATGVLTGNNGKLRTTMGVTGVSDIRIATTAALTAGTWVLDTDPFASALCGVPATAGTPILNVNDLFLHVGVQYPLVLAANEGFTIQATVPATGTWSFSAQVEWEELASF